jgi:tRNA A-37 threonylcarbamoyl transferase component Bud32
MKKSGGKKRCTLGKSCGATCINKSKWCIVDLGPKVSSALNKVKGVAGGSSSAAPPDYSKWNEIKRGNYGVVSISPDGTRAVKELLTGKDGKKGEFGPHEVELAKKMGELGHSPKIHRSTPDALEMDVAKGSPLWKDYRRGEDEPVMNAAQATKAAAAIRDLHKMGYFHGDMHALQFLVDGNNVKLVDYGLSGPVSSQPARVMQDLAKINALVNWKNPELANQPYFQLVNKYLDQYKEIKGTSQAAKNKKAQLGEQYIQELNSL